MQRRTDPISFRIKTELKQALGRLAQEDRRSLSQYIELALEDHVEAVAKRPCKVEALSVGVPPGARQMGE
jgi:predicted DNA-binding protein